MAELWWIIYHKRMRLITQEAQNEVAGYNIYMM